MSQRTEWSMYRYLYIYRESINDANRSCYEANLLPKSVSKCIHMIWFTVTLKHCKIWIFTILIFSIFATLEYFKWYHISMASRFTTTYCIAWLYWWFCHSFIHVRRSGEDRTGQARPVTTKEQVSTIAPRCSARWGKGSHDEVFPSRDFQVVVELPFHTIQFTTRV